MIMFEQSMILNLFKYKPYSFLIICYALVSCQTKSSTKFPILCDMETTNETHFLSENNTQITNAKSQNNLFARSGIHSAKINKENPFGLGCSFYNLKKGNQLIISVWEKADAEKGFLKIVNEKNTVLLTVKNKGVDHTDGWELITFSYELTQNHKELKFYIHNEKINAAYYDDLSIELYETAKRVTLKEEHIKLEIDSLDYQKLLNFRDEAIRSGIIGNSLKKYIRGSLTYKNKKIPIKLRFKGDWPDHLKSNKWSFRIQTRKGTDFKGFKSFSIQSPHTRSYLKEWIMHQVFKEQDILTTRYGFISVSLNNEQLGIYAYEEHFDNELLDYYNREKAPILKFNEEGLWETRLNNPNNKTLFPYYEAADVMPFKKKRVLNSTKLLNEFKKGSELMLKYKTFKTSIDAIFDFKKAAKIYALYDLGKIRHSYHWHNQRFYYNPTLNQLEHIAFDCYAGLDEGIEDIIYGYTTKETSHYNSVYLTKQLFNNSDFVSLYKDYLQQFSSEKFVKKIAEKHKYLCDSLSSILKNEFPNYEFNLNYLDENAKDIRDTLQVYDTTFRFNSYDINYDYNSIGKNYFNSIGLKAIIEEKHLELKNFHLDTLKVIGYSSTSKVDEMVRFNSPIVLSPYKTSNDFARIEANKEIKYLFFYPANLSEIKSCTTQIWPFALDN